MNINSLSPGELTCLVSLGTADAYRQFFLQHKKLSAKFRPGSQIMDLSSEEICSLVENNASHPAVFRILSGFAEGVAQDLEDRIRKRVEDGSGIVQATITTLVDSPFREHPALFFKLKKNVSPERVELYALCVEAQKPKVEHALEKQTAEGQEYPGPSQERDRLDEQVKDLSTRLQATEEKLRSCVRTGDRTRAELEQKTAEYEQLQKDRNAWVEELAQKNSQANEEQARLHMLLADIQAKNHSLEEALAKQNDPRTEDPEEKMIASLLDAKPSLALCQAYEKNAGNTVLCQVADISGSEIVSVLSKQEQMKRKVSIPGQFLLQTFLVCSWRPEFSQGKTDILPLDPGDSVPQLSPVEVIRLPNCHTVAEVYNTLIAGVECMPRSQRLLFCCSSNATDFTGLYCPGQILKSVDRSSRIRFRSFMQMVRVYRFRAEDLVRINGSTCLRRLILGRADYCYDAKDPVQVAKNLILKRCSYANLRSLGISRQETDTLRRFLERIPVQDLYDRLALICNCSLYSARKIIEAFVRTAGEYLKAEGPEGKLLLQALDSNPELMNRCVTLCEEQWKASHEDLVRNAERTLQTLHAAADAARQEVKDCEHRKEEALKELSRLDTEHENRLAELKQDQAKVIQDLEARKAKAKEDCRKVEKQVEAEREEMAAERDTMRRETEAERQRRLQEMEEEAARRRTELDRQQQALQARYDEENRSRQALADSLDQAIARKMTQARADATAFLAETAFRAEIPGLSAPSGILPVQAGGAVSPSTASFQPGQVLEGTDPETLNSWKDLVNLLAQELDCAGIAGDFSFPLAAFLYSAWLRKTPVLLAGPNGMDICDAFSTVLTGRTAAVLDLSGAFQPSVAQACRQSEEQVVAITDPLHPQWISHLPGLLAQKEKFFFALLPFAEDLTIEPRGLANYMLPFLTELVVEGPALRDFAGGRLGKKFAHLDPDSVPVADRPVRRRMKLTPGLQRRYSAMYALLQQICKGSNEDPAFLCLFFPYSYMTGRASDLLDRCSGDISKDLFAGFQAFLGEQP